MIATIYKKLLAYLEEQGVVDISAGTSKLVISTRDQIKFCDRIHCYSSNNTISQTIYSNDKTTYLDSIINISGLISSDANNGLILGTDNKLYAQASVNISDLISSDSDNIIVLGTDNKLYATILISDFISATPDNRIVIDITGKLFVGPEVISTGQLTSFDPNIIPFINGFSNWDQDASFNYVSGNLTVGSSTPGACRVNIKGDSDTTGKALCVSSLTVDLFEVRNNSYIYSNGYHMFGTPGDTPQAKIDISSSNGYEQLTMRIAYTPSSSADTNGNFGSFCWDNDWLYLKTSSGGWKRVAIGTF